MNDTSKNSGERVAGGQESSEKEKCNKEGRGNIELFTPLAMAPPFITCGKSSRSRLNFMFLSLLLPVCGAVISSGIYAAGLILSALLTALAVEVFFLWFTANEQEHHFFEASPFITALILALLLPADFPFFLVPAGVIFALIVARYPFGGLGQNLFNPAAAGFLFLYLSFPSLMPAMHAVIPDVAGIKEDMSANKIEFFDSGLYGAGSSNRIMVLAAGLMAVILARADIRIPVAAIASLVFMAAFSGGADDILSLVRIFMRGNVLFVFLLMAVDPVTSPLTKRGRILYGLFLGILTYVAQLNSGAGPLFALMVANSFVPLIDRFAGRKRGGRTVS